MTNLRRGLGLLVGFVVGGAIAFSDDGALAQLTPDTTLGVEGSVVSPNIFINGQGSNRIGGGAIRGSNLFHSFSEFNVSNGRGVYFTNPVGIQNILSRVTGNNPSNILGTLGVLGNANLFLINPNGIIFGPNASLNTGGSFVATTANAVSFENQGFFSTSTPDVPPLLTVNPSAFLFNQIITASIQNSSRVAAGLDPSGSFNTFGLRVPDGRSLMLVGGNVSIDGGGIVAFGGRVDLGGVAGVGTVGLNSDGSTLRLSFPNSVPRADVSIANRAGVIVAAGGGGSIAINARNVDILGGSSLTAGIGRGLGTIGSQAGDIEINATGVTTVTGSNIFNTVNSKAVGNAGNMTIDTGGLNISDGSQVLTDTFGKGNAGNLTIRSRNVEVTGASGSGVNTYLTADVDAGAKGTGGNLTIDAERFNIRDGAQVSASTYGEGNGGNLTIHASDSVQVIGTSLDGETLSRLEADVVSGARGNSGNLTIETRHLSVRGGAQVSASTLGEGNSGNLRVRASDSVELSGEGKFPGGLFAQVDVTGIGHGGNLTIETGRLSISDGSKVQVSTFGQGDAGELGIRADEVDVFETPKSSFYSTGIFAGVEQDDRAVSPAKGNGGNLTIETGRLTIKNGGQVTADTYGNGNAGSLTVHASGSVQVIGTSITGQLSKLATNVYQGATGHGGNLTIEAGSLSVSNGAQVSASTFGDGNAGSLTVRASDVRLNGTTADGQFPSGLFTGVQAGAKGNGGNLIVNTGNLSVSNGAEVSTTTLGLGNAGNLTVRASGLVELSGESTSPGGLFAQVDVTGIGHGGNLTIETGRLSVSDGSKVQVATFGQGDAGELQIRADEVDVFETPKSSFYITGIFAGVERDARAVSPAKGNGGNLTIETGRLTIKNGGEVSTSTYGSGNAGSLLVQADDFVEVVGTNASGKPSFLSANVKKGATGQGRDLRIQTGQLIVRDGGQVAVNSQGSGNAGNLDVTARSIQLDNQGKLTAETLSGNGGNIALRAKDLLLMRHNSQISTSAGTANTRGDGGNITINTPFIVAVPKENSDISANAYTGRGGNIQITAQGIFGTQFRPYLTPLSDITASSQFGVNGTVQINTPGVDPSRGLTDLATAPVDTSKQIAQNCPARGSRQGNSFIITGTGGLPPRPGDAFTSPYPTGNVRGIPSSASSDTSTHLVSSADTSNPDRTPATPTIEEAQGWVYGPNGEVILTAAAPTLTPQNAGLRPTTCPQL